MPRGTAFYRLTRGFKLTGETSIHSGVDLGVWRLSWVGEAIQEVGRRNFPPCLRNRLLPKPVHLAPGLMSVSDAALVDLKDLDARYG